VTPCSWQGATGRDRADPTAGGASIRRDRRAPRSPRSGPA